MWVYTNNQKKKDHEKHLCINTFYSFSFSQSKKAFTVCIISMVRMKSYLLYYTSKRLSSEYGIQVYMVAKQHPYYVDLSATDDPLLIGNCIVLDVQIMPSSQTFNI